MRQTGVKPGQGLPAAWGAGLSLGPNPGGHVLPAGAGLAAPGVLVSIGAVHPAELVPWEAEAGASLPLRVLGGPAGECQLALVQGDGAPRCWVGGGWEVTTLCCTCPLLPPLCWERRAQPFGFQVIEIRSTIYRKGAGLWSRVYPFSAFFLFVAFIAT